MGAIERPAAALGVLTGLNILNYLDRYVASAVLPLLLAGLSLTDAQGGALQSVFIIVYAVVSPLVGSLGDRRARLPIAALGVVLWSAATFGSGVAPTFGWFLLARALIGVGEASYAVVTPSLLADLYPPARRGRALAVFYAAIPVGAAFSYKLGGWVGAHYGWRAAFYLVGAPGLLLGLALLLLREPARGRYDRNTDPPPPNLRAALKALAARRSYLFNTAAQTIFTFSMGGLAHWMTTYFVRTRNMTLADASSAFGTTLVLSGFVGTIVGGQVGDRLAARWQGAHFTFAGWSLLASIPFTLMAILSPRPAIFWPAMFMTLFLLFVGTGPLNAAMANVLPPGLRGRGFAIYTVAIHLLGDALSPALIGLASDRVGLRLPVLGAGLLLAAAGVVLLCGRRALVHDLQQVAA